MTTLITQRNLSLGWLAGLEHLLDCGGKAMNVIVAIERPEEEDAAIRQLLDEHIADRGDQYLAAIGTVANTIFPQALYRTHLGDAARQHLYTEYEIAYPVIRRHRANRSGTYFGRLIAYPDPRGPINQLERAVQRLRAQLARPNPLSSAYELGVSTPQDVPPSAGRQEEEGDADFRTYAPGDDRSLRGFPCLSHVSLTLVGRRLHLTALYRNQHFIRKAYGNYLGLSRLLAFLCREAGCEAGEIVCVASHADAEIGTGRGFGRGDLLIVAKRCRAAAGGVGLRIPA